MINEVKLEGRLTSDPKSFTTINGDMCARFTIANPRTTTITDFIDCVAYNHEDNNVASRVIENCEKGKLCMITGKIQKDKREKDGQIYYNTYILVSNVE